MGGRDKSRGRSVRSQRSRSKRSRTKRERKERRDRSASRSEAPVFASESSRQREVALPASDTRDGGEGDVAIIRRAAALRTKYKTQR